MKSTLVLLVVCLLSCVADTAAFPAPVRTPRQQQTLETAVNILPEVENTLESSLMPSEEGKAGGAPAPGGLQELLPAPIKDRVPDVPGMMANSKAESPTLFIGGFSVMMMPMPDAADIGQMMQNGQTMMNMMNMFQQAPGAAAGKK